MFYGGIPADPVAFGGYDDGHDTETAPAGCHDFITIGRSRITAFACKATHRMSKIPEVSEGLFLHQVEEGAV